VGTGAVLLMVKKRKRLKKKKGGYKRGKIMHSTNEIIYLCGRKIY
jgi:hypothetical protein